MCRDGSVMCPLLTDVAWCVEICLVIVRPCHPFEKTHKGKQREMGRECLVEMLGWTAHSACE